MRSGTLTVEVVTGTGEGRTPLAATDAALAEAGIHNYNLVGLSSVFPAGTRVTAPGSHDGRWPTGTVVGAVIGRSATGDPEDTLAAGIGWATASEGGVFYEATGPDREACRTALETGLADARELRDWEWKGGIETVITGLESPRESAGAAVAVALYGPLAQLPTATPE